MSLLSFIDDAARRLNISPPATVIGNTDLNAALLLSLAQQEGEELSRRHDWQALVTEKTFTTVATQVQTNCILGITDYDRLIYNAEIWNRTLSQKYVGPTSSRMWQELQLGLAAGAVGWWRLLGGELNIYPAPTAGQTIAFEYVSTKFCKSSGGTAQATWTADTDLGRVPERLMTMGVQWRWLRAKGMDYAEEMATYERELERAASRDRGTAIIAAIPSEDYPVDHTWPGTITP